MSTTLLRRSTSRVAAAAAVAVVGTSVALLPTQSAQAADPAPTLQWEVSQYFDEHLSTHVLAGGATETTDGVITFQNGTGYYDPSTGYSQVSYTGSVAGSFVNAGTTFYTVTVADPIVSTSGNGFGQITAVVSSNVPQSQQAPAASTPPTRVLVASFHGGAWTTPTGGPTLTATPDWAGVLPAGSAQAQALGITPTQNGTARPIDGKSFNPAFLGALASSVRALFYASGSSSDPKKAPASFVAQAPKWESSLDADWAKDPKVGKKGKLDVSVTGLGTPTGVVTVELQKKGASKVKTSTATLAAGKATVNLGKLKAGTWKVTVSYAGDGGNQASSVTEKLKLSKAKKKKG